MGESFPMNGGDSAYGYANHSQFQKLASDLVKEMIQNAVTENLDAEISTTVTIADLGCSVGPNTFTAVRNLIESLQHKYSSTTLEFQVLFSDHSANDFNKLFASLPPERTYLAAGVPGSFHGRLFPSGSVTIAHSSFALHWLSKQPELGFLNEGRIHYSGASDRVLRAYSDQFETDLAAFMSARADEIVRGGLLLINIPGAPDGVPLPELGQSVLFDFLGDSLMDLASQGVVEKSAVDAFNLPMYFPTKTEMQKAVETNGSFNIERMELFNPRGSSVEGPVDVVSLVIQLRAATEGVFGAYFGESVVEKMFSYMLERTAQIFTLMEVAKHHPTQLLLVLKRN